MAACHDPPFSVMYPTVMFHHVSLCKRRSQEPTSSRISKNIAENHPETKWASKSQLSIAPKEENVVRHRVRRAYCSQHESTEIHGISARRTRVSETAFLKALR